jgi:hypothetical protein
VGDVDAQEDEDVEEKLINEGTTFSTSAIGSYSAT